MRTLTINCGFVASACCFEDGKCLRVYHEEKFNNVKNYIGFPAGAIQALMQEYKSVDQIIVFGEYQLTSWDVYAKESRAGEVFRFLWRRFALYFPIAVARLCKEFPGASREPSLVQNAGARSGSVGGA